MNGDDFPNPNYDLPRTKTPRKAGNTRATQGHHAHYEDLAALPWRKPPGFGPENVGLIFPIK